MRKVVFAAAVVPFFAAAALAQNASTSTPADTPPADTGNAPMAQHVTSPADAPSKGPSFIPVPDTAMLSGNVVGLDVYNGQNDDIGKIQDIILSPDSTVKGYIVSVGGFLGMGTHYVAVDPGAVAIKYDDNQKTWRAAMNATKDQLKSAPEFKYGGRWTASRS
jgi:sporulation protein YlmC with PRC-barrel domain